MKITKLSTKKSAKNLELAADYLRTLFNPNKEEVRVLLLDNKDYILQHVLLAQGTKNSVKSDLKKVFSVALAWDFGRIVIAHNHPGGDPHPSIEDIQIAKETHDLADQFGVDLYQIIIGEPSNTSLGFFDLTKIVASENFFEEFYIEISCINEELFDELTSQILDKEENESKKRKIKPK